MESREKEVEDIMFTLYDEERIMKNHDADLKRGERDKGIKGFVDITKKVGG